MTLQHTYRAACDFCRHVSDPANNARVIRATMAREGWQRVEVAGAWRDACPNCVQRRYRAQLREQHRAEVVERKRAKRGQLTPVRLYPAGWANAHYYADVCAFVAGVKLLPISHTAIPLAADDDLCVGEVREVSPSRLQRGLDVGWRVADKWMRWLALDGVIGAPDPATGLCAVNVERALSVIGRVSTRTYDGAALGKLEGMKA